MRNQTILLPGAFTEHSQVNPNDRLTVVKLTRILLSIPYKIAEDCGKLRKMPNVCWENLVKFMPILILYILKNGECSVSSNEYMKREHSLIRPFQGTFRIPIVD